MTTLEKHLEESRLALIVKIAEHMHGAGIVELQADLRDIMSNEQSYRKFEREGK